ncbi:substrate-binding domain-containing protein [Shimia sp. R9_3]|uniref:LacI family DNA-binding transcriptional regulator n=1 Tax=Shimia sp. R9_3 TaxID=2821113 RepID=UPI001ADC501D|nr:substrate-binding domain-containing protein [Shimia sp. R9_3]MBO9402470.1 substrate-binding domain-containing protein [Shimia sp. R9_3]
MNHGVDKERPKSRRVTAQAVADAVGVSRSAVSRAFTEGAYLDNAKRRAILQMAAKMGYQPNALAAGLQGGRSHLVAIFVGNMRSAYDSMFVSQLVRELNGIDKWPVLIDGGGKRAATAIDEIMRYPLDALILRGGSMSADIVTHCARFGIPMISSGRPVDASGVDNVCCRNALGSRLITERLIASGRKRFGLIAGPKDFHSAEGRREGVLDALGEAGLSLQCEAFSDYTVDSGHQIALEMLASNFIDALVCSNDASAIGALTAARELGRSVPGEIAIVGFDDIDMAKWPMFDLTTVRNPIDASVREIIALLERRLADPTKDDETAYVDPSVVDRGTH